MDVEFKLIGDLTMRQFAYLCVFGGLAYLSIIAPTGIFKIPLFLLCCVLGIGLAFVPIEERGLDQWIVNFLKAVYSPTQMIWKKENSLPSFFLHESVNVVKQELITLAPTSSRRQLEEYLRYQEGVQKTVDPLDIPEQEYVAKIRMISASLPDYQAPSSTTVGLDEPEFSYDSQVTVLESEPELVQQPEESQEELVPEKPEPIIETPESAQQKQQVPSQDNQVLAVPVSTPLAETQVLKSTELQKPSVTPPSASVSTATSFVPTPTSSSQPQSTPVSQPTSTPVAKPRVQVPTPATKPRPVEKKRDTQLPKIIRESRTDRDVRFLAPMTPDMHSGRRFTQLLPKSGVLHLPIRNTNDGLTQRETVDIESDLRDKAQKLQQLLDQIKETELGQGPSSIKTAPKQSSTSFVSAPSEPSTSTFANPVNSQLNTQVDELQKKLDEMQQQLENKQALLDNISRVPAPERTVLPERKIPVMENIVPVPTPGTAMPAQAGAVQANSMAQFLSSKPNTVTGVLKDPTGKSLESVLLLIKDVKGDPVRAFKTNKLGQFIISTPLDNGRYTLEVSPMNELGLTFDIISIEANGKVLPSLEVVGRN
jgi:hypothetical protein